MNPHLDFWEAVQRIRAGDPRYAPDAYAFVMESLDYTVRALDERRHISGAELVDGLCRAARERFGMLAYTVLERWGLRSGSDIGEIVFQLVAVGVLSRREEDAREDFDRLPDLKTALEDRYFETL
ncbi:MAG TPA: Minf_1886 family protein [Candidatus Krumholzibacteria bacterium]|nr:Minf_1886 family protein [Candidatus Krumholzibacteria bacterium]